MATVTRPAWITIAAVSALLLAGCTTTAGSDTAGGGESAGDGGGDTASSGACPAVSGYELFSSDLVTAAPESGAVYGDGSTLSFTLAMGAGYSPTLDLTYLTDAGTPVILGSQNLLDNGDGTYSNNLNVFDSDADGRPGFASVTIVKDDTFEAPAGQEGASQPILGTYCITFAVE
ncbi:MAG: hypothetical protein BGO97_00305 [Micrococcales bacterium 70-64]|nr:hypothetical protein [Leifsonia sp.]ODU65674.1 MAG: hypothetical protein ABT06_00305 [Leifsonia sp. SCN 70-46]OJX84301.1 MAG: hypothetical protein BGO97_00305 [Micrococcales bacterium 70-64]